MIRASIDIGSNSCLLLIANIDEDGSIETLESEARVTSLGKDLDKNKLFLKKSMEDTYSAFKEYLGILRRHNVDPEDVVVSATEASRVATNADKFFEKVRMELGFKTVKISGEGEAFYTALGVCSGIKSDEDEIVIMDIGGASTELIKVEINPFKIIDSVSLPIGSVRASDWLDSNSFSENFNDLIVDNLEKYISKKLICVAGTMTTLSAILLNQSKFLESEIQGHCFSVGDLDALCSKLSKMNASEIDSKYPLCGKRASSIYGGSLVATKISNLLKVQEIEISTLGLRYGVLKQGVIDERFSK
jgi:exopolyphosphatase/guanosine-5'-triphosphate,3'-diphosphate pyrophosphatase